MADNYQIHRPEEDQREDHTRLGKERTDKFPGESAGRQPRRRAGMRPDEEPDRTLQGPGAAGGSIDAMGTPGGGTSDGGIAGVNEGGGAPGDVDLESARGDGIFDDLGNEPNAEQDEVQPYSGHAGGAVGGTPANKRVSGGSVDQDMISPGGPASGESTVGRDPNSGSKMSD